LEFLHFQTFHKIQVIMVERILWLGITGPRKRSRPEPFNGGDGRRVDAQQAPEALSTWTVNEKMGNIFISSTEVAMTGIVGSPRA